MLETLKSELNFGDDDKIQLLIQGIVDDYRPKHETQDLRFLEIKNWKGGPNRMFNFSFSNKNIIKFAKEFGLAFL